MARSEEEILFKGNAAQWVQEVDKMLRKTKEHEAALKKLGGETRKVTKEEKEFAREAKKALDDIRGPQERHVRRTRALNELVKKGTINQREYRDAVRRSQERLEGAGRAGQQAFGPRALSMVRSLAGGFLSVAGSVGIVTRALHEYEETIADIAQKQRDSRMGIGSLAQLAESPEDMRRLVDAAKKTFGERGAADLDEAGRTIFAIESAGGMKHRKMFSQLKAQGLVDQPDVMARAAKTLIASMGSEETGSMRDLVSKGFGASKFSPASAEQLMEAAARSGTFARKVGVSDEAMLSATAMIATATGSAERGGTYLKQLMATLSEKGEFEGMTFKQIITDLRGRGMSGAEAKKYFGRVQGQSAFDVIAANLGMGTKEEPGFERIFREVGRAEAEDRVAMKLGLPRGIPMLEAGRLADVKQNELELARGPQGTMRNLANTLQSIWERESLERGDTRLGQTFQRWGFGAERWLLGSEAVTRNAIGALEGRAERTGDDELLSELQEINQTLRLLTRQQPVVEHN